jgi:uncharacterized membrane protein (UPF0127 family)
MRKNFLLFFVAFLLVGFLFSGRGCPLSPQQPAGPPPDATYLDIALTGQPEGLAAASYTIRAELADTDAKRKAGLAGRRGLEPGHGMLYVYAEPAAPRWGEPETPFPLSVAFVDADGTIVEIVRTEANDTRIFTPSEPVKYVLEVRQSWFEDRGAEAGVQLDIPEVPEAAQRPPAEPAGETGPDAAQEGPPSGD